MYNNNKQNSISLKMSDLRAAIPKHCFQRHIAKSLFFLLRDLLFMAVVAYLAYSFIPLQFTPFAIFLWILYAVVQGTLGMGIWVLGHQCGHGAFADSPIINDIVGFILHTAELVPYFSWQRSHSVHHAKCNHMIDGEAHVPAPKKQIKHEYDAIYKILGQKGFIAFQLINHSAIGWLVYLFFHGTGSKRSPVTNYNYTSIPNHYSPFESNELFPEELRFKVFLSTLGNIVVLMLLAYVGSVIGYTKMALMYFGPYVITFYWVVIMTWLQHTDTNVPHYGEDDWDWVKGATTTVDRPYPWIVDELHHHLGTTHVMHHLFPEIPHYNAVEASKALIPVLGSHYRFDSTPIPQALLRCASQCHYVQDNRGTQYPKSYLKQKKSEKQL